jgi:lysozyme
MAKKTLIIIIGIFSLCALIIFSFYTNGINLFNYPSGKEYPVRGVDVSSYQGEIDWKTLSEQSIHFAYIKATEGSSYIDPYFDKNLSDALNTNLRIGAYHFFSFDSSGKTQAQNFISAVPIKTDMLPPVVDIEFYGDKEINPPGKEATQIELTILLNELEAYYRKKPIIYATGKTYNQYIANGFNEYDIWIRNVIGLPILSDQRQWTFWQFTNRARLDGYVGAEKYIDMNVFNGTREDFDTYAK